MSFAPPPQKKRAGLEDEKLYFISDSDMGFRHQAFLLYHWTSLLPSTYYQEVRGQVLDFRLSLHKTHFETSNVIWMYWKAHLSRHFRLFKTFLTDTLTSQYYPFIQNFAVIELVNLCDPFSLPFNPTCWSLDPKSRLPHIPLILSMGLAWMSRSHFTNT